MCIRTGPTGHKPLWENNLGCVFPSVCFPLRLLVAFPGVIVFFHSVSDFCFIGFWICVCPFGIFGPVLDWCSGSDPPCLIVSLPWSINHWTWPCQPVAPACAPNTSFSVFLAHTWQKQVSVKSNYWINWTTLSSGWLKLKYYFSNYFF